MDRRTKAGSAAAPAWHRVNTETPVVIVGAGLMGLGLAVALADLGMRVCVLEQGEPGREASWAAAGMLAPHPEVEFHDDALLELGQLSAALWPGYAASIESRSGQAVGYDPTGTLLVARDRDDAEALQRTAKYLASRGAAAPWLDRDALRAREPALSANLVGGLLFEADHQVDNRALLEALRTVALRAGVEVRVQTQVVRVLAAAGSVGGVELDGGEQIAASVVVVAAGAWARSLEVAGLKRAPIRPVRGQMLAVRPPPGAPTLRHVVRGLQSYLVPKSGGRMVVGATSEERGFDRTPTAGGLYWLLEHARELLPGIDEFELDETWLGFRPGSRDNRPVLGSGALTGLFWATGHYRNGVQLLPATLKLMTHAICGEPVSALAAHFSPARFGL